MEKHRLFASVFLLAALSGPTAPEAGAATLSSGVYHTCAIGDAAAELRCWGYGVDGRLGNGSATAVDRAAPALVSTAVPAWRSVGGGENFNCGIAASGHVYCWGYNASGQLGDGTVVTRTSPVAVIGLGTEVAQLAVGWYHACALMRSGRINCWGYGAYGQLGSGQASNQTTPGEVSGIVSAVAVSAGAQHTCAVLADATVKCWGRNDLGQIGDGSNTNRVIPVFAAVGLDAVDIALGAHHSCARSAAGAVRCWGYNVNGELGDGTNTTRYGSVAVDGLSSGILKIAAGSNHTCALAPLNTIKCWGYNAYGQVGNGLTAASVVRPVNVINLPIPVTEITGGATHTCARAGGNRIYCWGSAANGRSGIGNSLASPGYASMPLPISGLPAPLARLSLRAASTCAVTQVGSASCWGNNDSGQIGDGLSLPNANLIQQAGPRDVAGLGSGVTNIATGEQHACALKSDGTVWCWGSNASGQLGDQTALPRRTPVQVVGIGNAVQIAASASFTCARTAPGAIWCWGLNGNGQLGIGSTTNSLQATMSAGLSQNMIDLSLGTTHACAVRNDGKVLCWGLNSNGQLGDSTLTQRTVPTLVNDGFGVYATVVGGYAHSCGLTGEGEVKCWGRNDLGQLGDDSALQRPSPARVATLGSGVRQIAAGYNHNCALRSSGEIVCWGYNNAYQIGDGTAVSRLRPVAASNVAGAIAQLALGGNASCAVLTNGEGSCWGNNDYGRLGNGSMTSPLAVPQRIAQWVRDDRIFSDGFDD
jgi:alpha-tubulin suppressor-like RCC1 family protein